MRKRIYEIREVRIGADRMEYGPAVDARKHATDAAVLVFRLNQSARSSSYSADLRYVYISVPVD